MCGEKPHGAGSWSHSRGSPPRVRGKVPFRAAVIVAGEDHPRVCGEKLSGFCRILTRLGSPPRVRGKALRRPTVRRTRGITPACAGKRSIFGITFSNCGDHPRVCGEKTLADRRAHKTGGSPPRVRGKGQDDCSAKPAARITPACAGKRIFRLFDCCGHGDHPRVCGEKLQFRAAWKTSSGSPPRVRGKELPVAVDSDISRITPAYAGKSMAHLHPACVGGDYPRVCREKRFLYLRRTTTEGSPPRMRGKVPSSI